VAPGDSDGEELPSVEIGASARAKRVRFEQEPETRVRHRGDYDAETLNERENLPKQVEAGETYRDVTVRWHTKVWPRDERDQAD
jgi:hypothetical protein